MTVVYLLWDLLIRGVSRLAGILGFPERAIVVSYDHEWRNWVVFPGRHLFDWELRMWAKARMVRGEGNSVAELISPPTVPRASIYRAMPWMLSFNDAAQAQGEHGDWYIGDYIQEGGKWFWNLS